MKNKNPLSITFTHCHQTGSKFRAYAALLLLLLLMGCSAAQVKMTDGHVKKLSDAFIGREFVFRTNWHKGMVVYQGKPVNNWFATMHNQTKQVKREKHKLGINLAMGGEVATITSVEPLYNYRLYLGFKTKKGKFGHLTILSQNNNSWGSEFYKDMTDQMATVAWIEQQLTSRTIRFFSEEELKSQAAVAEVEAPKEQLQLTPPPNKRKEMMAPPAIMDLQVVAEPAYIKRGGLVSLSLAYRIGPSQRQSVEVSEIRHLSIAGKAIPHYPKRQTKTLTVGKHSSNYRQKVPARAKPGAYSYRGEVCIQNSCSSQSVVFTVVP